MKILCCISIETFSTEYFSEELSFIVLVIISVKVGLLGMARVLQRDLNRIAEAADTSSPEGLSYVLTGEAPKEMTYYSSFGFFNLFFG